MGLCAVRVIHVPIMLKAGFPAGLEPEAVKASLTGGFSAMIALLCCNLATWKSTKALDAAKHSRLFSREV